MNSSGNRTVDQMNSIPISGNVTPLNWYKRVLRYNGKPFLLAITILSDIVYWYRPVEVRDEETGRVVELRKKFKGDYLQKTYKQYADLFGETKRSIKSAFDALEKIGVVRRIFRDVSVGDNDDLKLYNVMFVDLDFEILKTITIEECETDEPEVFTQNKQLQSDVGGGTLFCTTPYTKKYEMGTKNDEPIEKQCMTTFAKRYSVVQNDAEPITSGSTTSLQNSVSGITSRDKTITVNTTDNTTEINSYHINHDSLEKYNMPIVLDTELPVNDLLDGLRDEIEQYKGVPYTFLENPEKLKYSIMALAGWDDFDSRVRESKTSRDEIYVKILQVLIKMTLIKDIQYLSSHGLKYIGKDVIDQVNRIYHSSRSGFALADLLDWCVEKYVERSQKEQIKYQDEYIKSIIWTGFTSAKLDLDGELARLGSPIYG